LLVPAFAFAADKTTEQKFNELKEKGLLNGVEDGSAALDRELTRAELAAILVRLFKLEPITGQSTFIDVPATHWAQKEGVIEAVAKAGLMGSTTTYSKTFSPDAKLTIAEVAKVAVTALKLTVDQNAKIEGVQPWAAPYVDAALKAGLIAQAKDYHANANRGILVDAAYAIYQAILVPPVDQSPLEIKSFSATNLAELQVEFNVAIDEKTIDFDNIKVNGDVFTDDDDYTLSEDGKTLTLYRHEGFVSANQKTAKISISGIASVAGKVMPAVVDQVVSFTDTKVPQLTEVKALGNRVLTLVFSEPIKENAAALIYANYRVDNKGLAGEVGKPVDIYRNQVTLTLRTPLAAGEHTMSFVANTVKDYAGFAAVSPDVKFTIVEDTTKPEVKEVVSATQKLVEIKFNKEVDATTVGATAYWKSGAVTKTGTLSNKPGDKTVVRVKFDDANALPLLPTTLTIEKIKDFFGNVMDKADISVQAQADLTRPEVVSVTPLKSFEDTTWIIKFNKAVYVPANTVYNIDVKDKNGYRANVSSIGYNIDKSGNNIQSELRIVGNFAISGSPYTITIQNVEDQSVQRNKNIPQTFTVALEDTSLPQVNEVILNNNKLVVTYNKVVDPASAADLANYTYQIANGQFVAFPSAADIMIDNGSKVVTITLPSSWKVGNNTITPDNVLNIMISKVQDLKGNVIQNVVKLVDHSKQVAATITGAATATAKKTVVVKLSDTGLLPVDVYAPDFQVSLDNTRTTSVSVVDATLDSEKREITLTLSKSLNADGTYGTTKQAVSIGIVPDPVLTKDAFGHKISGFTNGMNDKIAPSLVVPDDGRLEVSGNKAILTFDEALAPLTPQAQSAFVVKDKNGKTMKEGTNYTVALSATDPSKVEITVISSYNGILSVSLTNNTKVVDASANANVAKDFTEVYTASEVIYVAPTAAPDLTGVSVVDATGPANNGKVVLNLPAASATGNTFKYKVSATAVARPNVGDSTDAGWTTVVDGAIIDAPAGNHIGVVEVDASGKVVKFKDLVSNAVDYVPATSGKLVGTVAFADDATLANATTAQNGKVLNIVVDGKIYNYVVSNTVTTKTDFINALNGVLGTNAVASFNDTNNLEVVSKSTGKNSTVTVSGDAATAFFGTTPVSTPGKDAAN
jgi:hypothetical protein